MARWLHTLALKDIWKNEKLSFEEQRDAIVPRIKAASFFDESDITLGDIVEGLEDADDVEEWDDWWREFYDWCDANRIWVETHF